MDESFDIPVTYKNTEMLFLAKLLHLGYIYKFLVDVSGTEVFFEKDEEGKFRASVDPSGVNEGLKIDVGLLEAIAESLEEILK